MAKLIEWSYWYDVDTLKIQLERFLSLWIIQNLNHSLRMLNWTNIENYFSL